VSAQCPGEATGALPAGRRVTYGAAFLWQISTEATGTAGESMDGITARTTPDVPRRPDLTSHAIAVRGRQDGRAPYAQWNYRFTSRGTLS